MKQPLIFSTGEPSYFVPASTPGSASPTVLTVSKGSARVCEVARGFIDAEYSRVRDAVQPTPAAVGRLVHDLQKILRRPGFFPGLLREKGS